ncbi:MAG: thiol peroxidase [Candidatus Omnitrophota bacterium]|jgi:thiol peroxidase
MDRKITFQAKPLHLIGRNVIEGSYAPDFKVSDADLNEINLQGLGDTVKIINSFPSLDTPVCDMQVKEFNKQAMSLSSDVIIAGVSMDLPFAQKRFCESNTIKNIKVFSDYRSASFGINYGLLIRELNLLARAVIIIDKQRIVRYMQIVRQLERFPDYADVLKGLDEVLLHPVAASTQGAVSGCKPCEAASGLLDKTTLQAMVLQNKGWQLVDDKKLRKEFKFKDFSFVKFFVDILSAIAEEQGHHPSISMQYNKVIVTLTTHAAGGLTENDFILSRIIDEIILEE